VQEGGWHALLLEDVGPKTAPPWTHALTRQAMRAYAGFHQASLGADLPAWLPRFSAEDGRITWQSIAEQTDDLREVAALAGACADDALRWLRRAEPLFTRLLASAATIPGPHALLHFDTRSDNLRLQDGRLRLFDWPAVEVGAVEIDVVAFAQSITVEGGPAPEQSIAWYGAPLRPDAVDVALAWLIGFFALRGWQPEIPGLPRLRPFQRKQLATLLDWSARRFHLPTPIWTAALAE
jgi:aminoglycoside phosphotransferase (APT) family kinase protein